MSGGSLHKKDWLKLGGLLALTATGAGAAGIGPMAGLFGAAEGAVGAGAGAGAAGSLLPSGAAAGLGGGTAAMFGPTAAGEGLIGLGATQAIPTVAEIGAGATAPMGLPALGQSATAFQAGPLSGLLPSGDTVSKSMKGFDIASKLMQPAQPAQVAGGTPPRPGPIAAPSQSPYGGKPIPPEIQAKLDTLTPEERQKMLDKLRMEGYA